MGIRQDPECFDSHVPLPSTYCTVLDEIPPLDVHNLVPVVKQQRVWSIPEAEGWESIQVSLRCDRWEGGEQPPEPPHKPVHPWGDDPEPAQSSWRCPEQSQELDSLLPVDSFQLRIFHDPITVTFYRDETGGDGLIASCCRKQGARAGGQGGGRAKYPFQVFPVAPGVWLSR